MTSARLNPHASEYGRALHDIEVRRNEIEVRERLGSQPSSSSAEELLRPIKSEAPFQPLAWAEMARAEDLGAHQPSPTPALTPTSPLPPALRDPVALQTIDFAEFENIVVEWGAQKKIEGVEGEVARIAFFLQEVRGFLQIFDRAAQTTPVSQEQGRGRPARVSEAARFALLRTSEAFAAADPAAPLTAGVRTRDAARDVDQGVDADGNSVLVTLRSIFPRLVTHNERSLRKMAPVVARINELESTVASLTIDELRAKTSEFRERLKAGATLDHLLPEAFAVVREMSKRVKHLRHFDVQLIGGVTLHEGKIAEMPAGEGKTLVATLAVYLNALSGRGAHVVTVNDYLAERDATGMGVIYRALGLSVGVIQHAMEDRERRSAYRADVTYGTANELGFDYLRDRLKALPEDRVQREHHFVIVDEIDSILIDEARTPLIISGPADNPSDLYGRVDLAVAKLRKDVDYTVDEKDKTVELTDVGIDSLERDLGLSNLYDVENLRINAHVYQAVRAHALFKRDVDYVVQNAAVVIVDEQTGRLMPGRRWADGLHQAIETKEHVPPSSEDQTLATITLQNYFRMYEKLAGMTGTADTEAPEFLETYKLDTLVVPTNRPCIRTDHRDVVHRTERAKWEAVIDEVEDMHAAGRPVLVGTISVEKSEVLSGLLSERGIPHEILNAKNHAREAEIVAQAGRYGAVTISTNMAGRGTDILLGGNPEFMTQRFFSERGQKPESVAPEEWDGVYQDMKAKTDRERDLVLQLGSDAEDGGGGSGSGRGGGLHVVGTERHESRRVDNQLRGRAGRQGDPGSSRFHLSLEDDLLRIFGGGRLDKWLNMAGVAEGQSFESGALTRVISNAQKQVEARHFSARKHLVEFDEVIAKQRAVIDEFRDLVTSEDSLDEMLGEIIGDVGRAIVGRHLGEYEYLDDAVRLKLEAELAKYFGFAIRLEEAQGSGSSAADVGRVVAEQAWAQLSIKRKIVGEAPSLRAARFVMTQLIDGIWRQHLHAIDYMRDGIGLRAYANKKPLTEFKREAFTLFEATVASIKSDILEFLSKMTVLPEALTQGGR